MSRKGQAAVEAAFVVAMLVAFVVFVVVPGLREIELDLALSNARLAGLEWSQENNAFFGGLDYSFDGRRVWLKPSLYDAQGARVEAPDGLKALSLLYLKNGLSPNSEIPEGACVGNSECCLSVVSYEYCL